MKNFFWGLRYLSVLVLHPIYSIIAKLRLFVLGAKTGKNFKVFGGLHLLIHPASQVSIGCEVRINSSHVLNFVGGFHQTGIHVNKNAKLIIGDRVALSNSTIVCTNRIEIEDNVFIGGDCNIYDTDFHPIDASERINNRLDKVKTAPILIKRGSFIGAHSIILKGVTIGENAIIGAGSLVSKDIPDNEIWAGNPIKKIRKISEQE